MGKLHAVRRTKSRLSSGGAHATTQGASDGLVGISSQRRHGHPARGGSLGGMAEVFVIRGCGLMARLGVGVQLTVVDVASGIRATYE
jgi:hypothetical protein